MLTHEIASKDHFRRLESWLYNLLPKGSGGYLRKLIRSGGVRVNGVAGNPDDLLRAGDLVEVKESERLRQLLGPAPPLDILWEDDRIIVACKPPGLPMHHAAEVAENLVEIGEEWLSRTGAKVRLRPVNRLDRGTSGGVILAKSPTAAALYGKMVQQGGLDKLYLAVVDGRVEVEGVIDEPLEGKEAVTRYRVLGRSGRYSFLAVYPETGRMHQIRQHLSLIGHPVAGDRRYGGKPLSGGPGHPLHAFRTAFPDPESGQPVVVPAPLPVPLLRLAAKAAALGERELLALLDRLL